MQSMYWNNPGSDRAGYNERAEPAEYSLLHIGCAFGHECVVVDYYFVDHPYLCQSGRRRPHARIISVARRRRS